METKKGEVAANGTAKPACNENRITLPPVGMQTSELFSQRSMTYNENSIALPSDRGTLEVSGANLMYEGARVKSWMLGRDLNPGGRGYGDSFPHGAFALMNLRPQSSITPVAGYGNSINNGGDGGGTTGECGFCDGLPPCYPGFCGEDCNCCSNCEDPADKCCCSCEGLRGKMGDYMRIEGKGCLTIPLVWACAPYTFEYADDHCERLKARTDMAYIAEFCAYKRYLGSCFDDNCPGHYVTGFECCYEYCKSMEFGGGGSGPGGGGGITPVPPPGGGGCGTCSSDAPDGSGTSNQQPCCSACQGDSLNNYPGGTINLDQTFFEKRFTSRLGFLSFLADQLARCLQCLSDIKLDNAIRPVRDLNFDFACLEKSFTNGYRYVTESRNKTLYGNACCFGNASSACCDTSGVFGIACSLQDRTYIMLYEMFWKLSTCRKLFLLIHEALHLCNPDKPHPEYTQWDYLDLSEEIVLCCFPGCKTDAFFMH